MVSRLSRYCPGLFVPLLLLLLVNINITAQDTLNVYGVVDTIALDFDLFEQDEPASITLVYDIKDFIRNKQKDEYYDAKLIYHLGDTIGIEKDIRIKARGNNRKDVCAFPPLWLNIGKAEINNSYLGDIKKIKLVTHCAASNANSAYVLKEYLIYKMYNLISPYSFRVRLLRVKYIDTGRKNKEFNSWGFLIEPEEMLAQRVNAFALKMDHIGYSLTDSDQTDIMSLFQFMIGNPDYSITGRHNIKLIKLNDITKPEPVPVPYDFDYSGFVNAHYAVPGEGLPIENVTERYFLGPCRSEERFKEVIALFLSKEEEINSLLDSFEYLDKRSKGIAKSYLDDFFLLAGQKDFAKRSLLTTCRDVARD